MAKYEPLASFLRESHVARVRLSFTEVERILGFGLPSSARIHRPWWANQKAAGHSQVRGWADAGWRTTAVDLAAERVVFERESRGPFEVEEAGPGPFSHSPPAASSRALPSTGTLTVRLDALSAAVRLLVVDYAVEAGGDFGAAVTRALDEAAVARRRRLISGWAANAPKMPAGEPDSVDLIREDRDAR